MEAQRISRVFLRVVLGVLVVIAIRPALSETATPVQVPATPAGKLLALWLETFNSGDREKIQKFQSEGLDPAGVADPARRLRMELSLRQRTGGFDLENIEESSENKISGIVKEKSSDHWARITLQVSDNDSSRIGDFGIDLLPARGQGKDSASEQSPPAKEPVSQITEEVDTHLTELAAKDEFSGALLLAKDGKILWEKAYGLADREAKIPNTVNTQFRLGSMSKMFTSVAIAQLVQQGKLKYSDSIAAALPDYPNKEVAGKITVEQLLTHTSGVGDFFTPEFDQKKDTLHDLKDYLPLFVNKPLAFEPGRGWSYSNAGFLVLGLIIEKISGENYYDYVQRHIYEIAEMKNSGSPRQGDKIPNLAVGYTRDEDGEPLRPNTATLPWRGSSAGGSDSTVEDLLRFDQALRHGKLLSPDLTKTITTGKVHPPQLPDSMKYAYGFGEKTVDGKRVVGHNGGAPGMNGVIDMHWDTGYTVIVLANRDPRVADDWANFINARLP